ncbi:MAG: galactose mutarotase, partial [Mucilaginibacter sp.]|nr:galactose mutarotase [Mucilaginibacter sp.]
MNLRNLSLALLPACMAMLGACNQQTNKTSTTTIMKDSITYGKLPADSAFEKTIDGKQTHLYTLKNKNGMEAAITN